MRIKKSFVLLCLLAVSGCGVYEPIQIIPDHIRTLRIKPFSNQTQQMSLTQDLTEEVTNDFIREGRLTVINSKNSDSTLEGTIIEYSKIPIDYDENFVAQEYKITIIVNLRYYDNIDRVMLWEDIREGLTGGLEASVNYYVGTDAAFVETEKEARARLIQTLSKKVLHRTVYGWE